MRNAFVYDVCDRSPVVIGGYFFPSWCPNFCRQSSLPLSSEFSVTRELLLGVECDVNSVQVPLANIAVLETSVYEMIHVTGQFPVQYR